jgi:hypothetical protein
MNLLLKLKLVTQDETGAVTIDWLVLTAAIVAIGVAVGATLNPTASPVATSINTSMEAVNATNSF